MGNGDITDLTVDKDIGIPDDHPDDEPPDPMDVLGEIVLAFRPQLRIISPPDADGSIIVVAFGGFPDLPGETVRTDIDGEFFNELLDRSEGDYPVEIGGREITFPVVEDIDRAIDEFRDGP